MYARFSIARFVLKGLIILALAGCGGASSDSVPLSLPVPFSGSFTGNTGVLIAEGNPVGSTLGSLATGALAKHQDAGGSLSWSLFKTQGGSAGTLTFFPDSISQLHVAEFSGGGTKRTYTMRVCTDLAEIGQVCSSNFFCMEFPTDYSPPFSANTVLPNDPGAVAEVRKLACSGNNDTDGRLLDGRFLMGMARGSDGNYVFYSQHDSRIFLDGVATDQSPSPEGEMVFTMIHQGGGVPQPLPPGASYLEAFAFPLFLPGSEAAAGTLVEYFEEIEAITPDLIRFKTDMTFYLGNSTLHVNNALILAHRIPEIEDAVREMVATKFAEDPIVTPEFLEKGEVFYHSAAVTTVDSVNCDPAANEATGVFRDLCDQHGTLRPTLLCILFADVESGLSVAVMGTWVLLAP